MFRGMTKEKKWVYGYYIFANKKAFIGIKDEIFFTAYDEYGHEIEPCEFDGFVEVIPETVGQATGLKDKNGKEIFEGDILAFCFGAYSKDNVLIRADGYDPNSYLIIEMKNGAWMAGDKSVNEAIEYHYVIGNIHEHPSLLENEK